MSSHENLSDELPPYAVVLAPTAKAFLPAITAKTDRAKVRKMLQILDTVPEIGRVYDPNCPAARMPFEMRVAFAGRYGIYYTIIESEHEVRVLFIEDQRRDPPSRFFGIYGGEEERVKREEYVETVASAFCRSSTNVAPETGDGSSFRRFSTRI